MSLWLFSEYWRSPGSSIIIRYDGDGGGDVVGLIGFICPARFLRSRSLLPNNLKTLYWLKFKPYINALFSYIDVSDLGHFPALPACWLVLARCLRRWSCTSDSRHSYFCRSSFSTEFRLATGDWSSHNPAVEVMPQRYRQVLVVQLCQLPTSPRRRR